MVIITFFPGVKEPGLKVKKNSPIFKSYYSFIVLRIPTRYVSKPYESELFIHIQIYKFLNVRKKIAFPFSMAS